MSDELKARLEKDIPNFKEEFLKAATTLFGSGWAWLVYNPKEGKLQIVQTSNAQTPVTEGLVPRDPGQCLLRLGQASPGAVRDPHVDGGADLVGRLFAVHLRLSRPHLAVDGILRSNAGEVRPDLSALPHPRLCHSRLGDCRLELRDRKSVV